MDRGPSALTVMCTKLQPLVTAARQSHARVVRGVRPSVSGSHDDSGNRCAHRMRGSLGCGLRPALVFRALCTKRAWRWGLLEGRMKLLAGGLRHVRAVAMSTMHVEERCHGAQHHHWYRPLSAFDEGAVLRFLVGARPLGSVGPRASQSIRCESLVGAAHRAEGRWSSAVADLKSRRGTRGYTRRWSRARVWSPGSLNLGPGRAKRGCARLRGPAPSSCCSASQRWRPVMDPSLSWDVAAGEPTAGTPGVPCCWARPYAAQSITKWDPGSSGGCSRTWGLVCGPWTCGSCAANLACGSSRGYLPAEALQAGAAAVRERYAALTHSSARGCRRGAEASGDGWRRRLSPVSSAARWWLSAYTSPTATASHVPSVHPVRIKRDVVRSARRLLPGVRKGDLKRHAGCKPSLTICCLSWRSPRERKSTWGSWQMGSKKELAGARWIGLVSVFSAWVMRNLGAQPGNVVRSAVAGFIVCGVSGGVLPREPQRERRQNHPWVRGVILKVLVRDFDGGKQAACRGQASLQLEELEYPSDQSGGSGKLTDGKCSMTADASEGGGCVAQVMPAVARSYKRVTQLPRGFWQVGELVRARLALVWWAAQGKRGREPQAWANAGNHGGLPAAPPESRKGGGSADLVAQRIKAP